MRQNYFIHNGKRYESGTIININDFNYYSCSLCKTRAVFLYYETDDDTYAIETNNKVSVYKRDLFFTIFCGIYKELQNRKPNEVVVKKKPESFTKELSISGMAISWMWYMFIMIIAIIFKDCIGIWILASVVFFNYRSKKLKEAGYK